MSSYGQVYASQIASTVAAVQTMQNATTGNGNGISLDVEGYTTINFEVSVDDSTWVPVLGTTTRGSSTTEPGDWVFSIARYQSMRARISAYGSGTITVAGYVSAMPVSPSSAGGGCGELVYLYNGLKMPVEKKWICPVLQC